MRWRRSSESARSESGIAPVQRPMFLPKSSMIFLVLAKEMPQAYRIKT
jgi:hypothetical protein